MSQRVVQFDEDEEEELSQYAKAANLSAESMIRVCVLSRIMPDRLASAPILNPPKKDGEE